jgi:hypothetical protein
MRIELTDVFCPYILRESSTELLFESESEQIGTKKNALYPYRDKLTGGARKGSREVIYPYWLRRSSLHELDNVFFGESYHFTGNILKVITSYILKSVVAARAANRRIQC